MQKDINGNTSYIDRMSRQISSGRYAIENAGRAKKTHKTIGITYYLLKLDGEYKIVSYREWNWLNLPPYILSGSEEGCLNYMDYLKSK